MGQSRRGSAVEAGVGQTRKGSAVEAVCNVAIGYIVAICSQLLVFPWFGIHVALADNLVIGLWFTFISLVRGYIIRRVFNRRKT